MHDVNKPIVSAAPAFRSSSGCLARSACADFADSCPSAKENIYGITSPLLLLSVSSGGQPGITKELQ